MCGVFFRIVLVVVILQTDFFDRHFSATIPQKNAADTQLHMIVYLQVAIISQALIFVTRSHGFFFMERPSYALMGAFCFAQLISSIIAGFANFGFTKIHSISGAWIGIVWVWVRRVIEG
jgi:H+-transporting ATPase